MRATSSLAVDLARECVYRFLSAALSDPRGPHWDLVLHKENRRLFCDACRFLAGQARRPIVLGLGELCAEKLNPTPLLRAFRRPGHDFRAAYDRVFGLVCPRECPPYETEYHESSDAFFQSQQLDDLAGFQ